jgi:hypothetical protein
LVQPTDRTKTLKISAGETFVIFTDRTDSIIWNKKK